MSDSPQNTPKRKRDEQGAEDVKVVRRSERQRSKGHESVMERAMKLKKARFLEATPSRSSRTPQEGSSSTALADSAGLADVLKLETTTKRVSLTAAADNGGAVKTCSSGLNCVALKKPASETATKSVRHSALAGNGGALRGGPSGSDPLAFDPLQFSTLPDENTNSTTPSSTKFPARFVNDDTENIFTDSGKDKGVVITPPHTASAAKTHAKAKNSASAASAQSGSDIIKPQSKKSHSGCAGEINKVTRGKKVNVLGEDHGTKTIKHGKQPMLATEHVGAKSIELDQKPMVSSEQLEPVVQHFRLQVGLEDFLTDTPILEPLGERCQLCGIDLAFNAKDHTDARSDGPPFSAVLPCSHCYHDFCLSNIFGPTEPPCVRCLEVDIPK